MNINQGDILKIERIKYPVVVLSKNFFNSTNEIIGCPIFQNSSSSPLHIIIDASSTFGFAQCEKISLIDLSVRGYSKLDELSLNSKMQIIDAVQSIFDYI